MALMTAVAGCGVFDEYADGEPTEPYPVTLDGNECSASVPDQLETGEYSFLYVDGTTSPFELYVIRFAPDKTLHHAFEDQREAGRHYDKPSWMAYTQDITSETTADGEVYLKGLAEPGEHAAYIYGMDPATATTKLWYCQPAFQVVEAET